MSQMERAVKAIIDEYDEAREAAHRRRDRRVKKINEQYTEILEIENEINRLGIENFGNILKNPQDSKKLNDEFEKKLQELNEKKKRIMEEKGIDPDYDKVKYRCEMCMDTGYIDTKKCPCFVKKLVEERYKFSNLGNNLHSFDEFSFDYYSDRVIDRTGMTERENITDIYDISVNFCENDSKNLLFSGGCGLGKTFLSSCVAKKMMDNGKSVIYLTASGLFDDYDDYKFGRKDDFDGVLDMIYSADLLIIDDLGAEADRPANVQLLFDVINKRKFSEKKMIISTNLTMNGIKERYTERIVSRILEGFYILVFEGQDIRMQMLKN